MNEGSDIKKSIGLFFTSDAILSVAWFIDDICKMTEEINFDNQKNANNTDFMLFLKRINPQDMCFYAIAPWLKKKETFAHLLKIQTLKLQLNNACVEIPLIKAQKYFEKNTHHQSAKFFNAKAIAFYGLHHKNPDNIFT